MPKQRKATQATREKMLAYNRKTLNAIKWAAAAGGLIGLASIPLFVKLGEYLAADEPVYDIMNPHAQLAFDPNANPYAWANGWTSYPVEVQPSMARGRSGGD